MTRFKAGVTCITLVLCLAIFSGFRSSSSNYGTIQVFKFNDLDGNHRFDPGEPGLEGVEIILKGHDWPYLSRTETTDSQGRVEFRNLRGERYEICEVVVPPWTPSTPECLRVTLQGKAPLEKVIFGNFLPPGEEEGCTRTQGFWGSSPAGQALLIVLVPGTMSLGNVAYTAAQLDSILDRAVQGNALLILTHQLIPAKLNILAGADSDCITQTIASADAAIGSLVPPPVGTSVVAPNTTLGQTMTALAATLDAYNNGLSCAPHCPDEEDPAW